MHETVYASEQHFSICQTFTSYGSVFKFCTVSESVQSFVLCFICFLQIVSETLPDLADLLPPSSSDVSLGLNTATAVDELLKLIT